VWVTVTGTVVVWLEPQSNDREWSIAFETAALGNLLFRRNLDGLVDLELGCLGTLR
jgi:hypothetical protein